MAKNGKKKMSRKQARRRRRRTILIVEVILLLLLLAGLFLWSKFGMITFDQLKDVQTNSLDASTKKMLKGYQNIAFFGVDNRSNGDYEDGRSDSIMICSINNDTKEVRIVSVYRDTFLDIKNDNLRKATEAYNYGGATNAINMLNKNLDMDITEYVAVDFNAVSEAVDAVGGVDLDEPLTADEAYDMNYGHAYIAEVSKVTGKPGELVEEGQTHLDGVQATAYCRVRYTTGDDYRRAERQRAVLKKLVEKAKQASVPELLSLVDAMFPNIATSMTAAEIAALIPAYKDYELVGTRGFPFSRASGTYGKKGSVVVPCTLESNVKALYEYLFDDADYDPSDTVKEISDEIVEYTGKDESDGVADEYVDGDGAESVDDTDTESADDAEADE